MQGLEARRVFQWGCAMEKTQRFSYSGYMPSIVTLENGSSRCPPGARVCAWNRPRCGSLADERMHMVAFILSVWVGGGPHRWP